MSYVSVIVRLAVVVGLVAGISGCEKAKRNLSRISYFYEGVTYKATIEKSKNDRQSFRVIVRNAALGLTGAKEAARLGANRYCIENYGSTDITYAGAGPDTENEDLVLSNGQLVFDGECAGW